jgi:hypothetical protein
VRNGGRFEENQCQKGNGVETVAPQEGEVLGNPWRKIYQGLGSFLAVHTVRSFVNRGSFFLNGKMGVSQFHFSWKSQIFVSSTMVLGFLARSEAIEATAFSSSTSGLQVVELTKHETSSAARSVQWAKI